MTDNVKEFLCVLKVTQRQGPGIIPVLKWDWAGNSTEGEKWELLACGLMVPLTQETVNIASERVIDAAEYAATKIEAANVPPSMPAGIPDPQEVTLEDFPAKDAPVLAQYDSPADYSERTGKRFRMTKDQKERGLSRDEAFAEFVAGLGE